MRKKNILLLNIICIVLVSQAIAQNYDYNTANVCDTGSFGKSQDQVAYMCTHQALGSCQLQQAVQADGYSSFAEYGFGGYGSNPPSNYCCRCFQIQVQDGDAPAKDIIVQGINTGGDVNSNQFDLSMIAGGFGANNGCANQVFAWNGGAWDGRAGAAQYSQSAAGDWCSDPTSDNSRCQSAYSGGITKKSDCAKLPNNNLTQLCEYSFDSKWRTNNGNRDTIMKEVRCPAGLIKLSGCNRDDSSLPYPSGKLSASDPSLMRGKLTHMWDCCKPSCSWTANVLKANGTAVMSCDASGTNILGTNTSFQCTNFTCDPTCKTCSASNDAKKCTSCNTGHYLSSNPGQCTACTPSLNCQECSNSSTCTTCQTGYTLQIDGSCKKPCDQSCKTCSTSQDATQCTSCYDGYYLNGSSVGTCSKCPSGCTSCTSNSNCLACTDNYVLISGSCEPCDCPCLSCKTDTSTCTSCIKGYILNGNTCEATCDSTCKTCSKNQDATQCTSCNSGFYLDGTTVGSCVQCSQNCSSCTSKNSCQTCTNNTILVSGQCQSCKSPCQTCQTSVTNCLSCVQGYTLNRNTCSPTKGECHPSCKTCSVNNDQNACTSCFDGFLILGSGNCQPCQPPCYNCSGNPNNCTQCASGYAVQNGTCQKIK
ncbi:glycoside hydrolase family 45 protein (macronuclear) [Tetrahymena thermophila SB210]|uniref:cellulase n=1 Tax=Tetrahymena thermophila (strain SB210) TaxID=312017 RepID=Q22C04_TETTS|nr:glycoside hydrolase family 45 protein [Tetrahymena thermophila SB210]EAR82805.1 glycoside hydrolase family 45 protein [Tetrahymena thermophila SB210]|eukprot:XP_001030468.1 glycoside hydrolase family 45 protein [Tetrahymena thermophila SB210]